jgi:VWFA-related protein
LRISVRLGVLVLATCSVALLPATTRSQSPTPQLTLRTGITRIQLDVVVTDRDDRPITDLSKHEFEVTERGRRQAITDFQFVGIPVTRRTLPSGGSSPLPVDVVTNVAPARGRQWVLVIDDLHIIEQHLLVTKNVVRAFLDGLSPDDSVATVLVGRSDLGHDFTSDFATQMRTLDRVRPALGFALDASSDAETPGRFRDARATIAVLKNVCASLATSSYPRKAVVYVSEGMTYDPNKFDGREVMDQLRGVFQTARDAGVPVYTVDPRGLPDCTAVRSDCKDFGSVILPNVKKQQFIMRTIAENTGGLAFVNRANMTSAVEALIVDNTSFYLLAFEPDALERDGTFKAVDVSVMRPGVRVRARRGYVAPGPATAPDARPALDEVLGAALAADGLSLRAVAVPVTSTARGVTTAVAVELTYPAALGSKVEDEVEIGLLAVNKDGDVQGSSRRTFRFSGAQANEKEIAFAVGETIDLPREPLILRIGIASRALGRAGRVDVPLERLNASRREIQIGGILLGLAGTPPTAVFPSDAFKAVVGFQPTTARAFDASDTLRVLAPVFPQSANTQPRVTMTVRDERTGQVRGETAMVPAGSGAGSPEAELPLRGFSPGPYVIEIVARSADRTTARRVVSIAIK